VKVFYSDTFEFSLPIGHRFPREKYRLLREALQASELRDRLKFCLPDAATDEQLLLVHTAEYLDKLKLGTLSSIEQRRIGFPWSPGLVERSRRSTGATIGATKAALLDGAGVHLAGGTHHAFPDHGQGFCVFNDVAVAIRVVRSKGLIRRAVVIDLDVHQGNGTAAIFADDPDVFTFSMHGQDNFPFAKCKGDLDIALPTGASDEPYHTLLRDAIERHVPFNEADIIFYLAGADPFAGDRIGKLGLTKDGLAERDRLVFDACRRHSLPIALVMAGGYPRVIEDSVAINVGTVSALICA
jgi:acetoin utilization deacetylase AcuC-like enzyme